MKMELNDETLTAYALGELDAAETKAVEKLLAEAARAGNDVPRKTLEEIRAAATLAEEAFADGPETALTDAQREAVAAQVAKPRPVRWGRALVLAASVALVAVAYTLVARYEKNIGTEVASYVETPAQKAEREWNRLRQLRPGIERAFIGDINGPGGSSRPPDFEDKNVQQSVSDWYDRTVNSNEALVSHSVGSGGLAASASKSAIDEETRERMKALGYSDQSAVAGAEVKQSSGNLVPSGAGNSLRIRGNFFAGSALQSASPEVAPAAPPAQLSVSTPALRTEETEELSALGYVNDFAEVRTRIDLQEAKAKEDSSRNWRYQTARADYSFGLQPAPVETPGAEAYAPIADAPFVRVSDQPLSTFSIDVDTASYSNVRRFLQEGQLPPPNAVRVEELINYFDYAYPAPTDGTPFASHFEAVACPWQPQHTLVRIGLKGREVPRAERPASNLVFLIDVSGSMQPENKLPLVKRAMAMLTRQLDERDRVAIVTYASGVSLALPPTNAGQQNTILSAIEVLGAGGSTNGEGGIQLAYESARRNFLPGGVNRVILATDGDFNVGISDNDSLVRLIQQEAKSGVFLSVFGFGMGNLKDDKLEMLADKGNGVYGYIDSEAEARKVFVEKLSGTLVTIAKDVKIQVEFNPARVAAYRLVGYENRALAAQDFNDDRKDAGEIGAGHTVTALYEVVPTGLVVPAGSVDTLRYQTDAAAQEVAPAPASKPAHANELLLVKLRYKEPQGDTSKLLEFPLKDVRAETMSADLKFASAVAAFGKLLRGNQLGALNYDGMMQLAQAGLAGSTDPQRSEMIHLMLMARPMLEVQLTTEERDQLRTMGYIAQ